MDLIEIGRQVRDRRLRVGLSQARLAKFAGLSRATINQLETGVLVDLGAAKLLNLCKLLELRLEISERGRARADALDTAARTASVSYRRAMDGDALADALASDELPPAWLPHIATWLDEAPLSLIVSSVESAAARGGVDPRRCWNRIERWTRELGSPRHAWS